MLNRLREACKAGSSKMSGDVSSDETYFGGLSKNKHSGKKPKKKLQDKTMVQGVKADNQLKLFIVNTADKKTLQGNIAKTVEIESNITTDEHKGYKGLDTHLNHFTVKHSAGEQVSENGASTNDLESVWALMKRGYKGVYHHWSKKHLHRYIDEFAFRLDSR